MQQDSNSETTTTRPKQHERIGRLDGIRALAIMLVFATHANLWKGGWIGVPFFFALSGLLITRILRGVRRDTYFWGPFYIKRATRILPPLVIAFALAAIFFSIPWRQVGLYYVFFAANIVETMHRGAGKSLGILWSLAVEEQFYLLWPFAVRFMTRKHLIIFLVCVLALEPALRAGVRPFLSSFWPIYFLTPFQLDGLALGSLLALLLENEHSMTVIRRWSGRALLACVILWTGLSCFPAFTPFMDNLGFNAFGYTLISLLAVSLLAYVLLNEDAWISRILSLRLVVMVGTISYGFYLFHTAILDASFEFATRFGVKRVGHFSPVPLVLTLALSWVSFHFYEQRVIQWGKRKANALSGSKPVRLGNTTTTT